MGCAASKAAAAAVPAPSAVAVLTQQATQQQQQSQDAGNGDGQKPGGAGTAASAGALGRPISEAMAGTGDANGASKAGTASAAKPTAPPPPVNPEVAEVDRILQMNLSLAIHADSTSKVIKLDDAESIVSSLKASENGAYQAGRGRPVAPEDSAEGDRFGSRRQQQESADGQSDAGPPVDPNDPWSSLQTAYRIKGDKNAKGGATTNGGSKGPAMGAAGRGSSRTRLSRPNSSKQHEELVLLDDEEAGGLVVKQPQPLYAAQARSFRQPPKAGKQNGWGQGEFAAAGTLMLGDEQLNAIAPPGAGTGNYWDQQRQEEKALPVPKQPKHTDDLAFEDVEDFDTLLEQEFKGMGIANPDLAAKLAAFEAQQDDD